MNDGIEILDAKQYFEELQRVMVSFPKDGIDQIAETFLRAYDTGRTVYLFGNGEAPRSHPILLVILEKARLTVMEGRGSASSLLPTICQL